MQVLVKNNLNISGTVLQDTVVIKSCNGHINKDTITSILDQTITIILEKTHAQKQMSTDNFMLCNGCNKMGTPGIATLVLLLLMVAMSPFSMGKRRWASLRSPMGESEWLPIGQNYISYSSNMRQPRRAQLDH